MGYKLLRQDCHPDSWSVVCVEGIEPHVFNRGLLVREPQQLAHVTLSAQGQEACDFIESPCAIVSDRMRRTLERAGIDNIEWFPAELELEVFNSVHRGFWIMNLIGRLACVDVLASDVEEDDQGRIVELRSFQIDPNRTHGLRMFRLADDLRVIVVSDGLQNILEAAGLRGVLYQDPAAYNRGLPISSRGTESPAGSASLT